MEVAVLNACSKLGRVQHEPLLDGTSKLDLLFTTKDGSKFLADITTVSDEGLEEKEPVEAFNIGLKKRLKRAGLLFVDGRSLSVRILRPTVSATRAAIPSRNDFKTEVFNSRFKEYIKAVQLNPRETRTYIVRTPKTQISLTRKSSDH